MLTERAITNSIERQLRDIAARHMRRERRDHTLQPTALVNETWLRLHRDGSVTPRHRSEFFIVASHVMRQILIDHARAHQAGKRSGGSAVFDLAEAGESAAQAEILDIHNALEDMAGFAPRQVQLVELRFFGGLSMEEAASVLGVSPRTADKDWKLARAWLRSRLAKK